MGFGLCGRFEAECVVVVGVSAAGFDSSFVSDSESVSDGDGVFGEPGLEDSPSESDFCESEFVVVDGDDGSGSELAFDGFDVGDGSGDGFSGYFGCPAS